MKIRYFFVLLALAGSAYADPFLVSDYHSSATNFELSFDDGVTWIAADKEQNSAGKNRIHYDVGSLADGDYTVIARARNAFGASAPSSPFFFTKAVPAPPTGIHIQLQ